MRRSAEEPENEENAFQDAFRRKLHNYQAPVSPQEWNRLSETLRTESQVGHRPVAAWLAAACLTLLLVAGSLIGYFKLCQNDTGLAYKTGTGSPEKGQVAAVPEKGNKAPFGEREAGNVAANAPDATGKTAPEKSYASDQEILHAAKTAKAGSENTEHPFSANPENAVALNQEVAEGSAAGIVENGSFSGQKPADNSLAFQHNAARVTKSSPGSTFSSAQETGTAKGMTPGRAAQPAAPTLAGKAGQPAISATKVPTEDPATATRHANALPETSLASANRNNPGNGSLAGVKSMEAGEKPVAATSSARQAQQTGAKTDAPEVALDKPETGRKEAEYAGVETNARDTDQQKSFGTAGADSLRTALASAAIPSDSALTLAANTSADKNGTDSPEKTPAAETASSRWQVAVTYSALKFDPDLAVSSFGFQKNAAIAGLQTQNLQDNYRFEAEREFSEGTTSAFSWNTEVKAGYALNAHFTVHSGLAFTAYATETPTQYYLRKLPTQDFGSNAIVNNNPALPVLQAVLQGSDFPDNVEQLQLEAGEVRYDYNYLGLPLELQYRTNFKSKWNLFAAAGATFSRLVKGTQTVTKAGNSAETSFSELGNPFRKWQTMLHTDAGLSYRLNQHVQLTAGLEGNFFLQSLVSPNPYVTTARPESFGLQTGLSYRF